jgi:diguanylate cyclase (GGDEF)-like protein
MGDRSIKKMIKVLQNSIREYDLIFRMGGDEFLMLFPNADYSESIHLISRIRKKILEDNRDSIAIDFSFGVCEFDYQHPVSAEDLITMADQKMYSAKTNKKTNHDANQN